MTAEDQHDGSEVGRIEMLPRPAWRSRLNARAPRMLAGALAAMLMVAGLRSIVFGPDAAPAPAVGPAAVDVAAESFAESFARAYLSWEPDHPEVQQEAVARFVVDDIDPGAGVDQREPQTVLWTAPIGTERRAGRMLVTVEVVTNRGTYRVVVPIQRDDKSLLAVVGYPALVGGAATSLSRPAPSHHEVEDAELRTVAGRAVRNYLAGERRNLLADLDPAAVVSLPDRPLEVESVNDVVWIGPRRIAVQVTASDGATAFVLSYELSVVKRERWYVQFIAVNPTHLTQRSKK